MNFHNSTRYDQANQKKGFETYSITYGATAKTTFYTIKMRFYENQLCTVTFQFRKMTPELRKEIQTELVKKYDTVENGPFGPYLFKADIDNQEVGIYLGALNTISYGYKVMENLAEKQAEAKAAADTQKEASKVLPGL